MQRSALRPRRVDPELVFTLLFGVVVAIGLYQSLRWGASARLFPQVVGTATLLIIAARLVVRVLSRGKGPREERIEDLVDLPVDDSVPAEEFVRRATRVFLWVAGFLVATLMISLNYSAPAFLAAFFVFYARLKLWMTVALTVGTMIVLILFQTVLGVRIPEGLLLR